MPPIPAHQARERESLGLTAMSLMRPVRRQPPRPPVRGESASLYGPRLVLDAEPDVTGPGCYYMRLTYHLAWEHSSVLA